MTVIACMRSDLKCFVSKSTLSFPKRDLFETLCNISTITPEKSAELENSNITNLEKSNHHVHHTAPLTLPLKINALKIV